MKRARASKYYVLDGHEPVPCDLMTWARWFETAQQTRIVAQSDVAALRTGQKSHD